MKHSHAKIIARLAESKQGQDLLNKTMDQLDKEAKEGLPKIALRNDSNGDLDDVVVKNVESFRAEMMDDQHLWMACYFEDGERIAFWVQVGGKSSRAPLNFNCTEQPMYEDFDTGSIFNDRK